MDTAILLLFVIGVVAVFIGIEVREGRARGIGLDAHEVASRIGKLDPEGRQEYLFALGPRLGSPKTRTRLIEINNGIAVIQSLDGEVQIQGHLRAARWRWHNAHGWGIELVVELFSPDRRIHRTVRGNMRRNEAKLWPELADSPL